jgi:hypothetical protein
MFQTPWVIRSWNGFVFGLFSKRSHGEEVTETNLGSILTYPKIG